MLIVNSTHYAECH